MSYLGAEPVFAILKKDSFTGDNTTTDFPLSHRPGKAEALFVIIDGVPQEPTESYTVNNFTLSFTEAPYDGANIFVLYRALDINRISMGDASLYDVGNVNEHQNPENTNKIADLSNLHSVGIAPEFLRGYIDGLELANNSTDSEHDIDISPGVASLKNSNDDYRLFRLTSTLTKQIDGAWIEGNNTGGFPSGLTLSADTHYNVILIGKDDGTVDVGFDTDESASNLLADATNYEWYRRIGSIITDGSSNIIQFTSFIIEGGGLGVTLNSKIVDINNTDPGVSRNIVTLSAPPNARVKMQWHLQNDSSVQVLVDETSSNDRAPSSSDTTLWSNSSSEISSIFLFLRTDPSRQIAYRSNNGTGLSALNGSTLGWLDGRRD